jgi:hypothetical protein
MIFNLTNLENYPVIAKQRAITCFKDSICFGDEEIKIIEPFNRENHCKSWANNTVYCIKEDNDGTNFLTKLKNECFTITEIELWSVKGELPLGYYGEESKLNNDNMGSDRWRSYQILQNTENILGEGSYAKVYKIKEKKTNKIFAAKFQKIKTGFMNSKEKLSM